MANWQELLIADHTVIEKVFAAANEMFEAPALPRPATVRDLLEFVDVYVDKCHSMKEERHLFPMLGERGLPMHGGPIAMMLHEHEESRVLMKRLKELGRTYLGSDTSVRAQLANTFKALTNLLGAHFWKENDILYPMGARILSPEDGENIVRGIEAIESSFGDDTRAHYYEMADRLCNSLEDLSANLPPNILAAMLNALPVELSFIDAEDTVVYFSHEDQEKIFPRNRSAIGTKVQNCHPSKSVHLVNQILVDFKAGTRDVAEFWIDFKDSKIHIRYFPVRDKEGAYLGCLEVVQDVGPMQAMQGQRRLLDET